MQARKEFRKWVNRIRRKWGKRNGVLPNCVFDTRRGPWSDKREKRPRYPAP